MFELHQDMITKWKTVEREHADRDNGGNLPSQWKPVDLEIQSCRKKLRVIETTVKCNELNFNTVQLCVM